MPPLEGIRVVELAGSAPAAFAATILAGLGADVVRIDRPSPGGEYEPSDPLARGRRSVAANLKDPADLAAVKTLLERADVFLEGFKPGFTERYGLGPDAFAETNPRLVYARVTGWGQQGPWSTRPGHDLSFLAVTGLLDGDRLPGAPPAPPSTYLSSFAGGGLLQALGVLAALQERHRSGLGQVVDAAMADGAALLDLMVRQWREVPGRVTVTDAPFYSTYACGDGGHVAVGAIEPHFYAALVTGLGIDGPDLADRADEAQWPRLREQIAAAFLTRPRDHWTTLFEEHEACVFPVLTRTEAAAHEALAARATFVDVAGHPQPSPSPRFSRTPLPAPTPPPKPGLTPQAALLAWPS
ncbi:CaiB/BaiF CoA-transferase family protein [Streptomyces subrutilus]|uniref:CaiB/BaiF CoA transferase family protein n=1 Tax=Streptomyces subrutilus TaxID=36818 RepID=UPI00340489EF